MLRKLAPYGIMILLSLGLTELAARLVYPAKTVAQPIRTADMERAAGLRTPGEDELLRVAGVYAGAGSLRIRTSERRFIEPDSHDPAARRVLFLGGSTTLSKFVPESERWVALLAEPGEIATYNAGKNTKNTIDAYFSFLHFTEEQGLRFDLVVLATTLNDLMWMRRIEKLGGEFRTDGYHDFVARYRNEVGEKSRALVARQTWRQWVAMSRALSVVKDLYSKVREQTDRDRVLRKYEKSLRRHLAGFPVGRIALADCPDHAEEQLRYEAYARANIGKLAAAVAETGADFLVLSEANSYAADPESFLVDLRQPLPCGDELLEGDAAARYLTMISKRYLRAAADVGAHVFDLAPHVSASHSDGGRYMYDFAHYTPIGSREVADVLSPTIRRILSERAQVD